MSLLKLRSRQRAIKNLHSILAALQIVTVVRLQRVREKYAATQDYLKSAAKVLSGRQSGQKLGPKMLVVIAANRGLCGNFNYQLSAAAINWATTVASAQKQADLKIVVLGKRAVETFHRRGFKIHHSDFELVERPSFTKAVLLWQEIFDPQREIYIAYNTYQSTVFQVPKIYRLYPLPEELAAGREPADCILEPQPAELISRLFTHYLAARFFQLLIDSQMGELAARLMVLKGAVDNSRELIGDLTLAINKVRQANITRDLAEIIGSAEALRR